MKEILILSLSVLLLLGCASSNEPIVVASLEPSCYFLECTNVHGMVHFQNMGDGSTEVHVRLTGVPPGEHGVHIYESGECPGNGLNAGRHFNPMGVVHGAPNRFHHAGDLGNVTADPDGHVRARFTTDSISLAHGATTNPVGHPLMLTAKADDLMSQPSGDAGVPISCGVIHRIDPETQAHRWEHLIVEILLALASSD